MRVGVIGAGPSGLCAIRYLKAEAKVSEVVAYEASGNIGGVWNYTDETEADEYGTPIFSSLYKNLRTNNPKQGIAFPGYFRGNDPPTFTGGQEIRDYLENFAIKEDLKKYVKFRHLVTHVSRVSDQWILTSKNMVTKEEETKSFDSIFVCNGYNSEPYYGEVHRWDNFKGEILHSHHYRRPENYSEKNVMVIGGGPSGEDIAIDLVKHAKTVFWSHHASHQPLSTFPSEINMKPDVKNIKNESVVFVDDTEESIDTVIFCTGYKYHMPFLDESCKLEISTFRVYPLYRHIVNANEPTMFVFCLLKNVLVFRAMDLQARYSVKALVNGFKLPSKESMLKTINEQDKELLLLNRNRQKEYHTLRNRELSYYNEVAEEAGIESVKPSIVELLDVDIHKKFKDVLNYRRYVYTVIDDHTISIRLPEDEEETLILAGTTPRFIKGGGGC